MVTDILEISGEVLVAAWCRPDPFARYFSQNFSLGDISDDVKEWVELKNDIEDTRCVMTYVNGIKLNKLHKRNVKKNHKLLSAFRVDIPF